MSDFLRPRDICILIEDSRTGQDQAGGWWFAKPRRVIETGGLQAVPDCLAALDQALAQGHWVAGWMAYEAGHALEPRLTRHGPPAQVPGLPLLWFGVFDAPLRQDGAAMEAYWTAAESSARPHGLRVAADGIAPADYRAKLARIHDYIAAGDVYQVNFTFPRDYIVTGDPRDLYRRLRRAQRARHGAFIHNGDWTVLSLSPELFFAATAETIACRPMKGTLDRRPDAMGDQAQRERLAHDAKNRAENLMIVDLIRNDLARVAAPGSVAVDSMFDVEALPSVLQMTSAITARRAPGTPLSTLFKALFPCGSVTGAPKIRAMEIIAELESAPRGIYTGAIGFAGPDGSAQFSVPIRTLLIDRAGRGRLGIGSGIVAESGIAAEYHECLLKARFLDADLPPFDLFETLRWTAAEGYWRLDDHLDRLAASAAYFGFAFDAAQARALLAQAVAAPCGSMMRVKLSLSRLGEMAAVAQSFAQNPFTALPAIGLAAQTVRSDDRFLYHKTTQRGFYETARRQAVADHGWFEVVFENERGEITEGSFSNVFIERDGKLLTPALTCGLLPGVLRGALLRDKDVTCEEAVLTRHDLATASRVYVGNALRGLVAVQWVTPGN